MQLASAERVDRTDETILVLSRQQNDVTTVQFEGFGPTLFQLPLEIIGLRVLCVWTFIPRIPQTTH